MHPMWRVLVLTLLLLPALSAAAAEAMRSFVKADLRAYDGSDPDAPIMIAIQGIVFDVSSGPHFYSKTGPYNQLVGKEATKAVGLMSLEAPGPNRAPLARGLPRRCPCAAACAPLASYTASRRTCLSR